MLRLGTKDRLEREDEEVERLVRPSPKVKPPRRDRRREEVQVERDPDVESDPDLKGDPDLSLNYKTIGGSLQERVALRFLAASNAAYNVAVNLLADNPDLDLNEALALVRQSDMELWDTVTRKMVSPKEVERELLKLVPKPLSGSDIRVYHATDPSTAKMLLRRGFIPETKPRARSSDYDYSPGRGVDAGLYVGESPQSVEGYGRAILEVVVPKRLLDVPTELAQLGETNALKALHAHDGAVINHRIHADAFRLMSDRTAHTILAAQKWVRVRNKKLDVNTRVSPETLRDEPETYEKTEPNEPQETRGVRPSRPSRKPQKPHYHKEHLPHPDWPDPRPMPPKRVLLPKRPKPVRRLPIPEAPKPENPPKPKPPGWVQPRPRTAAEEGADKVKVRKKDTGWVGWVSQDALKESPAEYEVVEKEEAAPSSETSPEERLKTLQKRKSQLKALSDADPAVASRLNGLIDPKHQSYEVIRGVAKTLPAKHYLGGESVEGIETVQDLIDALSVKDAPKARPKAEPAKTEPETPPKAEAEPPIKPTGVDDIDAKIEAAVSAAVSKALAQKPASQQELADLIKNEIATLKADLMAEKPKVEVPEPSKPKPKAEPKLKPEGEKPKAPKTEKGKKKPKSKKRKEGPNIERLTYELGMRYGISAAADIMNSGIPDELLEYAVNNLDVLSLVQGAPYERKVLLDKLRDSYAEHVEDVAPPKYVKDRDGDPVLLEVLDEYEREEALNRYKAEQITLSIAAKNYLTKSYTEEGVPEPLAQRLAEAGLNKKADPEALADEAYEVGWNDDDKANDVPLSEARSLFKGLTPTQVGIAAKYIRGKAFQKAHSMMQDALKERQDRFTGETSVTPDDDDVIHTLTRIQSLVQKYEDTLPSEAVGLFDTAPLQEHLLAQLPPAVAARLSDRLDQFLADTYDTNHTKWEARREDWRKKRDEIREEYLSEDKPTESITDRFKRHHLHIAPIEPKKPMGYDRVRSSPRKQQSKSRRLWDRLLRKEAAERVVRKYIEVS